ncbi:MAG: hypothetical protein M0002_04735 [Rhodospirillales bacterium]|nr:hypothetical protein [Rhodospirillales bacterium]
MLRGVVSEAPEAAADAPYTIAEITDPLADLAARAKADPAIAFSDDVIEALAELRAEERGRFEAIRAELKRAGVRVTELDPLICAAAGDEGGRQTQADLLLELADTADLFHDRDKRAFADIRVGDVRETWPVKSTGFRRWLGRAFYQKHGGAPNSDAMASALAVIEAKAHYDAPERPIFLRIGEHDGRLYLDLGDETWRAIEIDAGGWCVVSEPPCRFRRAPGMLPLPEPTRGGSIEALRGLLNISTDQQFILSVAWLLATFRPAGPYPVLIVSGEHGAAKTSFVSALRALIDPNTTPMRSMPREDRDLFISATNAHVLAFDNLSGLPAWLSDALCRLATGGGFSTRALWTDGDEVLFDAMRPIALNGIEDIVSRPDLADRGLFMGLAAIAETERKTDKEMRTAIETARPAILGALLDAVSRGLARLPGLTLPELPRMADFAIWAVACGDGALWPEGAFVAAFGENRAAAIGDVIEGDVVASALVKFMADAAEWTGPAGALRQRLGEIAGEAAAKARTWPANDRALAGKLRRIAPFLRSPSVGIEAIFERDMRGRYICLRRSHTVGEFASFASCTSSERKNGRNQPFSDSEAMTQNDANDVAMTQTASAMTQTHDANDGSESGLRHANQLKTLQHDANDANDANSPTSRTPGSVHTRRGVI